MVDGSLSGEERLEQDELCEDAAERPYVDALSIVCGSEDEFRRAVVPGTQVRSVNLARTDDLGGAEVAVLDTRAVHEYVAWLDITVGQPLAVHVGEATQELIAIHLKLDGGELFLVLAQRFQDVGEALWNVFHHKCDKHLILTTYSELYFCPMM